MDFNKLWQNFMDTVTNHYFDTNGRVGRAQFWYYILVVVVLSVVVNVLSTVLLHSLLSSLFALALLLPNLGMSVRRLQDTGTSGMLAWACFGLFAVMQVLTVLMWISGPLGLLLAFLILPISLIALVAAIAVIYFCAQPGQTEANPFGPVPPAWTPN